MLQQGRRSLQKRCKEMLWGLAINQNPSRHWSQDTISNIMMICVILYNMVIEDE
jgi:hypothetical protein